MGPFFKTLAKVLTVIQQYILVVTSLSACLMIIMGAILRYFFEKDFYGSEELILLAAFWLYFIGASLATREDSHIAADLVSSHLKSPFTRLMAKTIKHAVSLCISLLASYWAYKFLAWNFARNPKTPAIKMPYILMQMPILICFILSSLYLVGHLITDIRGFRDKG
ncbi:MAG: TRAP transporter small permease subunit [Deltaproteobacteria bacterium]|jgi:TRAP-type C4-dicarboxylate transport system permease small subunit|nr:TRAP transporter small permease subunit [Deltaproteobacteria bacterium]